MFAMNSQGGQWSLMQVQFILHSRDDIYDTINHISTIAHIQISPRLTQYRKGVLCFRKLNLRFDCLLSALFMECPLQLLRPSLTSCTQSVWLTRHLSLGLKLLRPLPSEYRLSILILNHPPSSTVSIPTLLIPMFKSQFIPWKPPLPL